MKDVFTCLMVLILATVGLALAFQSDAQPVFADQQVDQTALINDVPDADVGCTGGSCCPSSVAKRTVKRNFSLNKKVEVQQTQEQEQVVATPKVRRQPIRGLFQRLRRR